MNRIFFIKGAYFLLAAILLASSCNREQNSASDSSAPLTDKERQQLNLGFTKVMQELQDAQLQISELQKENAQLREQLSHLENHLSIQEEDLESIP